jgi:carbon monoxide dehydrogenase subunit G
MKLQNEFTVAVPVERVWETLLDIETVAGFLPGATIEPGGEEGTYKGAMKVKLGPMTVNYTGTARLASVDESARTADIEVRAKEAKGQGTAAAVIRNTLVEENGSTRVVAVTDLQITGRQAQFGRGIMQDVAGRMLGQFAGRFEDYLLAGDGEAAAAPGEAAPAPGTAPAPGEPASGPAPERASRAAPAPAAGDDAMDLGSVITQIPALRYAGAAALVLLLLALLLRGRGRRGFKVSFDLG